MKPFIITRRPKAPASLKENVMKRVDSIDHRRRRLRLTLNRSIAAAVILSVCFILPLSLSTRSTASSTDNLLKDAITSLHGVKTLDMNVEMRTTDGENFEAVVQQNGFVSHHLQKSFATHAWRLEKPGRTLLFDGHDTYMWTVSRRAYYERGVQWNAGLFTTLLEPQLLMRSELQLAKDNKLNATLEEQGDSIVLTIVSKAKVHYIQELTPTIPESNHRRIYVFNRDNHLLRSLRVDVNNGGRYVTVLRTTSIRYNVPISQQALTSRPANLEWADQSDAAIKVNKHLADREKPEVVVRRILKAMAVGDTLSIKEAFAEYDLVAYHQLWSGMQVVSVGKAYQMASPVLYYVPCSVRLKDGSSQNYRIVLRCDNSAKQWIVDGGI